MTYGCHLVDDAGMEGWDTFVRSHPLGPAKATTSARLLWDVRGRCEFRPVGCFHQGRIVGGLLLLVRKLHGCPIPLRVAPIPVLLPAPQDPVGTAAELLRQARQEARRFGMLEIEVNCRVPKGILVDGVDFDGALSHALAGDAPASRSIFSALVPFPTRPRAECAMRHPSHTNSPFHGGQGTGPHLPSGFGLAER